MENVVEIHLDNLCEALVFGCVVVCDNVYGSDDCIGCYALGKVEKAIEKLDPWVG